MTAVHLDEDFFRLGEEGGGGSDAGGQEHLAIDGDIGGFDDGPIEFAEEAVADVLRQEGKVHVEEMRLSGVDAGTEVFVGLVGCAELDRVRLGEFSIEGGAGGCTGDDADFEIPAGLMFRAGFFGDGGGDDFRCSCRGESAESDHVVVFDESGGFVGGKDGVGVVHDGMEAGRQVRAGRTSGMESESEKRWCFS